MAYDVELAVRISRVLASEPTLAQRQMFGGLAFLIRGHMVVAASSKGGLMIRADPTTTADLVRTTGAEYAEMRGRRMRGWLHLGLPDVESDQELALWVNRAVNFSATSGQET